MSLYCLEWFRSCLKWVCNVPSGSLTSKVGLYCLESGLDKFKTSGRTRPFETQRLGAEFFCKEHTKPLFNKLGILAFQICLETLKTLKSRTPQSLCQLYLISIRNNQLYLRVMADDTPYIKSRVNI